MISDDEDELEKPRPKYFFFEESFNFSLNQLYFSSNGAGKHAQPLQPRTDYSNIREMPQQQKPKSFAVVDTVKLPPQAPMGVPIYIPSNKDVLGRPPMQAHLVSFVREIFAC